MTTKAPKFKVGDRVIANCPYDFNNYVEGKEGEVIQVGWKENINCTYLVMFDEWVDGHNNTSIPDKKGCCWWLSEKALDAPTKKSTAQERLDMLAKYFKSGNDVPVQKVTIKAEDFWKIYNGDV